MTPRTLFICESDALKIPKYKGQFSMDRRKWEFHSFIAEEK